MPNNNPEPPDSVARLREELSHCFGQCNADGHTCEYDTVLNGSLELDPAEQLAAVMSIVTRDWLPREAVEATDGLEAMVSKLPAGGIGEPPLPRGLTVADILTQTDIARIVHAVVTAEAIEDRKQEIRQRLNITVTDKREASDGE